MVPDKKVGLVAEPNANSIAEKIVELYHFGEPYFLPFLLEEKKKYSWQNLVSSIIKLKDSE